MATPQPITLGAFELQAPLARGGMGVVWRGVHRRSGLPVAAKVMTGERARQARFQRFFRNEARLVAGLDHPHVVLVFDQGTVSEAQQDASGDRMPAGSPYLVMELARAGTLRSLERPLEWPQLRQVMLRLLGALGHAHARGVLHLDIKPANVLLGCWRDEAPVALDPLGALRLADFGNARNPWSDDEGDLPLMGTPRFMAPEQHTASREELGPWTDLYALGCLAFHLLSGQPPFHGADFAAIGRAHLLQPLPPLASRVDVPAGFLTWVRWLLGKSPEDRPSCAADAAKALRDVGTRSDDQWVRGTAHETVSTEGGGDTTCVLGAEPVVRPQAVRDAPAIRVDFSPPELPATMPTAAERELPQRMVDAGLGVFGLRNLPMVGRGPEREALWEALATVHTERRARAVVLRGPLGSGKTRLAEWLTQAGHELGVATPVVVHSSPIPSSDHGLAPALGRWLGCRSLSGDAMAVHLRRRLGALGVLEPWVSVSLAAWLASRFGEEADAPGQPHAPESTLTRVLEAAGSRRVVVLVIEDAHWDPGLIALAERMLRRQAAEPTRLLFVLTVGQAEVAASVEASEQLQALAAQPLCTLLDIEPLTSQDHRAMVQRLLPLEPRLASRIVERSGGNPLFALQMLGDLVLREALLPGDQGYTLAKDQDVGFPVALHEVWLRHLDRVAGDPDSWAWIALERAAALGLEVDRVEWAGVTPEVDTAALMESLLSAGLAKETPRGWAFVHPALAESLEREATARGRLADHHRVCARFLESHYTGALSGERLGRHLLGARLPELAYRPLLDAARLRHERGEYREAWQCAEAAGRALELAGALARAVPGHAIDSERPTRSEWLALMAEILIERGEVGPAITLSQELLELAVAAGSPVMEAQALELLGHAAGQKGDLEAAAQYHERAGGLLFRLGDDANWGMSVSRLGSVCMRTGDLDRAAALFRTALDTGHAVGNIELVVLDHLGLSDVHAYRGETDRAVEHARAAMDALEGKDNIDLEGRAHYGLARVMLKTEDWDAAAHHLHLAIEASRRTGHPQVLIRSLNALGEVARYQGRLDEAQRWYRQAVEWCGALGHGEVIPHINLVQVLLMQKRYARALALLKRWRPTVDVLGAGLARTFYDLSVSVAAAGAGEWELVDEHLFNLEACLAVAGMVDRDLADLAQHGLELCVSAERSDCAVVFRGVAIQQWSALGERARAEVLERQAVAARDGSERVG